MRYLWGRADWKAMKADLSNKNWEELNNLEADAAWTALKEFLHKTVEEHVPKRRRRNHDRPGWLSQEVVREIRKKKKQWKAAKQGVDVEKYKETENKVRNGEKGEKLDQKRQEEI